MTPQEFSAKIRTKYPTGITADGKKYSDLSDDELTKRVVAKYPVYKSQIKEPTVFSRISTDISKAGADIENIISEQDSGKSSIEKGFEATAKASSVPLKVATELLPKSARKGIEYVGEKAGDIVSWLGEKIGDTKKAQDFITQHPEAAKTLEKIANVGASSGEIAGNILVADQAVKGIKKTAEYVPKAADLVKEGGEKLKTGVAGIYKQAKEVSMKPAKGIEKMIEKPLPKPVENVISETPVAKFDEYINTAKNAVESYKNTTPLELAGEKAQDALLKIQDKLSQYGKLKSGSVSTFGDKPVGTIATKFKQSLESIKNQKTLIGGDSKLVDELIGGAKNLGNNPSALDVDKFVDFVQDKLYTSTRDLTVPVTDSTTGAIRKVLGEMNKGLKSNLPASYSRLNDLYSKLIDIRNELNTKLGKEGERGGSLMKRVFSPSDANTKKLFESVKNETGVDLVNEATLARFAMETMGDARQASLLEQLNLPSSLSKKGLLDFIWDKATESVNTPEKIIERARAKTKQ
jgi:hypothetical protein